LLTAILEKAINIEQIGIWASSGAERWLQLQSLLRSNNIETQSKPPDANTLIQNLKWLAEHTDYNSVTSIISQINDDDLKKLQSATGILHFKNLLKIWEENKTNDDELFWQEVFSNRSEIISQVFSYPVVVLKDKAYVGGKLINNLGGKVADYLYQNKNTKNAIIVEIKTPMTRLLKSEYRPNVYSVSEDLSGSVNQTLLYVNSLLKDYYSLDRDESSRFEANNPRSLLIIGSFENEGIVGEKKKSFETFRNDLRNIDVITFNELFGKIAILLTLLQQSEIISE
jgi:lipopolysaccharide biosynthesis glycosyltransferase